MKINGDLKFRTLGSGELQNAIIERVAGGALGASLPTGAEGRIAFNTDTNTYWFYGGGQWNEFGGGGDISNIVNSGGYMFTNGTFDPTAFAGFINISPTGSPMANLVDALAQLDAAVTVAAGVDSLKELTDVNIDGEGGSGANATGQLLYYKDGTTQWTSTSVTALSDGDILTWNNSTSTWEPTENTNVVALPDLTDVDDTLPGTGITADDGKVLRYSSARPAGTEWSEEDLEYITTSDGDTYISLTGAGAINPRVDGNSIHFYIDTGSAELVARFLTTELEFNAPAGGGIIDINAGANASGAGGNVTIDGGQGTTGGGSVLITGGASTTSGEGGDVTLTGGTFTTNSGDINLYGGGSSGVRGSIVVGGSGGTGGNDGGNVTIASGDGSGTDGQLSLYSGLTGAGTGVIQIQTAGRIQNKAPYVEIVHTTAANSGVVRFQEGTTNGVNYVGLRAPDAVGADVVWGLPTGLGSPDDAVYVLGVDTLTTGGGTNQTKWVSATSIGGNSFATWSNSGGTGDGSIIAETTDDTVTFVSRGAGSGINAAFNATTDTVTLSMTIANLASGNAIVGGDSLWFSDGGTVTSSRTFTQMLADLNIVNNVSGTGIVVQTAADTYASRSVAASVVAGDEGISVVNGDGVAGNPTVGLDIVGLGAEAGTPSGTDVLAMYDGTNNVKVSIDQLTAGVVGSGVGIDDLADVTITGPTAGDVLVYGLGSPQAWENLPPGATSGVQAHDASLDSIAGLSLSVNDFLYVTDGSPETFGTLASGTTGRALLGDETVADAITTLGLDSGGVSDIWVDTAGDTMSGNLDMSGGSPQDARILLTAGTVGAPGLTWFDDLDTGLFHHGANAFCAVTGGVARMTWDPSDSISKVRFKVQDGSEALPGVSFELDPDTGYYRPGANLLAFSAGGSERLRIYGTNIEVSGSPPVETTAGAISVENTASYEALIGDPSSAGFTTPVDDFLPNAQWVDLYYLRKSGGTMSGDIIMDSNDINMAGGSVTNLSAPSDSLDAVNKNYVDNLVASGTVWVNPVENPDFVGIADDEPDDPLISGLYLAYGGASYPQYWSRTAGSPVGGSPSFIEVNEYDLMHYTFGEWDYSATLENGTRLLVGVFTNAIDTKAGQNLVGTGLVENDIVEYIGFDGSPSSDPFNPNNWNYPHGRVGGVKFDVVSITSATKTFVIEGDVTRSFHPDNTFTYDSEGSPAGSGSPFNDGLYTIDTVTYVGPNTEVVVEETVPGDGTGGTAEPELRNGLTTLTSNADDTHFGQSYLYVADDNEWVQISGPGQVGAGIGLSYQGNTLNVNLGAGIFEQPGDEVGLELYNAASGGLILTTDGTTRDNGADSKLHLLLAAGGGLDQGTSGLFIQSSSVTNDMLENSNFLVSGDAGTPTTLDLGDELTFVGTNGVVVTVTPNGGSPLGSFVDVGIDLVSVPNSALANSSIGFTDGTTTDEVALGEDTTVTGGIVGANTFKIRRIEDADGDTYVQTSTGVADDSDTVSAVGGTASLTLSSAEADLTGSVVDINATGGAATIDASSTVTVTGGTGATLTATTGNATVSAAAAGNVYLTAGASGNVDVRSNRELRLRDADNSAYIGHKSNATVSSSITYEWPEAPAGNDYVLVSSTGGVMSWASPDTVGRTTIATLDDVVVETGSPGEGYIAGQILVASGGSPNQFVSQDIQYIYDSTLTTPSGSPETTVATTHVINHNLGQKYVNVTVYNTSDQQIIPQSVTLNSANQLTVVFNSAIDCVVVIMGVPGVTAGNGA